MNTNNQGIKEKVMFYETNKFRAPKAGWISRSLVLLACLVLALPVTASWLQRQKITSTPRGVGAQFGNAVAISGLACGSSPYRAACALRLNTVSLQHGVSRQAFLARCEKAVQIAADR